MKKIYKSFVLVAIIFPAFAQISYAATDFHFLDIWAGTSCRTTPGGCGLCDALIVGKNIIDNLFAAAILISVAMIVVGAFFMITSGGSEKNLSKGKDIMKNALFGLLIALSAWIIVNTLMFLLTGRLDFPWNKITC